MTFDTDVFISYAHLDNQELVEGHKGWVDNLHRALEIRVGQLLGSSPQIWRDPKLGGSDFFADTLIERVRKVAVLVTVISPRYVKSEWTRRELSEFWNNASGSGGVRVGDKARVFKVLKTPVPLDLQPGELQQLIGYEFYKIDPSTGRVRELDEVFGPDAQREFWMKLDDVAHDLCAMLQLLYRQAGESETVSERDDAVYLAATTSDLQDAYESIRRDLEAQDCLVLPARPLPLESGDLEHFVRSQMDRCKLSIHLVGEHYSLVPEDGTDSVSEIQNRIAVERGRSGGFSRLLWIPPGLKSDDPRQQAFLEQLRTNAEFLKGADLIETALEDFRTVLHKRLEEMRTPPPSPATTGTAGTAAGSAADPATKTVPGAGIQRVYLIHDQRDQEAVQAWADFLFNQGLEVIPSVFEGDPSELREYHEENLRTCDGVVIFFGAGNDCWLRRKLREVQKIAGYGRAEPIRSIAVCVAPPASPDKARFRTHEALVLQQVEGFSPEKIQPFLDRLKSGGES